MDTESGIIIESGIESGVKESLPVEHSFDLAESTNKVAEELVKSTNNDRINDLTNLFNQNIKKKNVLRILTYNNLLDKVDEQLIARVTKRPDEISNKELLEMISVIEQSVERAHKTINDKTDAPVIQINNQTNEVHINNNNETLSRSSREKIIDVIKAITEAAKTQPKEVVEAKIIEESGNTVYTIDDKENK